MAGSSGRAAAREGADLPRGPRPRGRPTVHWFDDEATDATVLEFRADDAIGLLHRVTAALERCGLDIRSARISSLGGAAVDAFYVTTRAGGPVPAGARSAVEAALARI